MINIFGAGKDADTGKYVIQETQLINSSEDHIDCITPPVYECLVGKLDKRSFIFMEHHKPGLGYSAITAFSEKVEHMIMDNFFNVEPDNVVADIGSGYGIYTLRALLMGARFVYAFEPIEEFSNTLMANIRLNRWIDRASILYSPLWSSETIIDFEDQLTMAAKSTMFSRRYATMTLDKFFEKYEDGLANFGRLDIIKMDVEGAELEVIKGARDSIRRFKPRMIIELHKSDEFDSVHELIQAIDKIDVDCDINILFVSVGRSYAIVDFVKN